MPASCQPSPSPAAASANPAPPSASARPQDWLPPAAYPITFSSLQFLYQSAFAFPVVSYHVLPIWPFAGLPALA